MSTSSPATRSEESSSVLGDMVRGWDRFWFSPADPTTLAMMRIFCGLIVCYVNLCYSWELFGFIGPNAWLNQSVADYLQRDIEYYAQGWNWNDPPIELSRGNWFWSIYHHVHSPAWVIALHVLFILAPLLFALGLFTRVFGVLAWIGAMSYCQRASNSVYGLDTMMMILLAYLNLGPSGATLSLDRWLQCRRARRLGQPQPAVEPSYAANFAIRLTQVHFCIIYLATGTSKLLGPSWWAGTALNLVLLNNAFAPLDQVPYYEFMKWLAGHRVLWEITMTTLIGFTLLLEISFPFLVWNMRWRWLMMCGSVMLHTGIGLFMGLGSFSLMMMVMVLSFMPSETMQDVLAWLRELVWSDAEPSNTVTPVRVGKVALTR